MRKIIFLLAATVFAGSNLCASDEGHVQGQDQSGMSLAQLVQKCQTLQSFGQVKAIDAQITCSADRLVWVNRGVKGQSQFQVPATGVQFGAHIKGKYQSQQCGVDLKDLLSNLPLQLQKWRFNIMKTVTIKSCEQLQAIADDPNYCAKQCSQLQDANLQTIVLQKTSPEQTTIESDNLSGVMVEEILTSPSKVTVAEAFR